MLKIDLKKQLKHLYQPPANAIQVVDVPPMRFAMVNGQIEPGHTPGISPEFQEAVQALYGISYTLKFMAKKRPENAFDYSVMTLEALWWVEDGIFDIERPDNWVWTAMIYQPDLITEDMFTEGLSQLRKKKPGPGLDQLRFETFHEGLSLQTLHIGPYSAEPGTIRRMHAFARENGFRLCGKHHEIYLGDPRRGDPAKLKTILRQPIEKDSTSTLASEARE